MRKHGRRDVHHQDIISALRKAGCSVLDLGALGGGCPDILVGRGLRDQLLEIKTDKEKPTPAQKDWHEKWKGRTVIIVRSVEEALLVMGCTQ
jgi:Holliday junction resolvase